MGQKWSEMVKTTFGRISIHSPSSYKPTGAVYAFDPFDPPSHPIFWDARDHFTTSAICGAKTMMGRSAPPRDRTMCWVVLGSMVLPFTAVPITCSLHTCGDEWESQMSYMGFHRNISGWWLTYPSEKYEFVNWDDDISNWYRTNKSPRSNHHQPEV